MVGAASIVLRTMGESGLRGFGGKMNWILGLAGATIVRVMAMEGVSIITGRLRVGVAVGREN